MLFIPTLVVEFHTDVKLRPRTKGWSSVTLVLDMCTCFRGESINVSVLFSSYSQLNTYRWIVPTWTLQSVSDMTQILQGFVS